MGCTVDELREAANVAINKRKGAVDEVARLWVNVRGCDGAYPIYLEIDHPTVIDGTQQVKAHPNKKAQRNLGPTSSDEHFNTCAFDVLYWMSVQRDDARKRGGQATREDTEQAITQVSVVLDMLVMSVNATLKDDPQHHQRLVNALRDELINTARDEMPSSTFEDGACDYNELSLHARRGKPFWTFTVVEARLETAGGMSSRPCVVDVVPLKGAPVYDVSSIPVTRWIGTAKLVSLGETCLFGIWLLEMCFRYWSETVESRFCSKPCLWIDKVTWQG